MTLDAIGARHLRLHQDPTVFVEVLPLDLGLLLRSAQLRDRFGLLVNDSLVAASALESNVSTIPRAMPTSIEFVGLPYSAPLT